jgi:hypothetical protein
LKQKHKEEQNLLHCLIQTLSDMHMYVYKR